MAQTMAVGDLEKKKKKRREKREKRKRKKVYMMATRSMCVREEK